MAKDSFYRAWYNMKTRCRWPKSNPWKWYGGKGITYCTEWESFKNFERDMRPSYREGLTLDRIDSSKSYSKKNCRWATHLEQQNNKSSVHLFEFDGQSHTLTQWSGILGVKRSTLAQRIYVYKWPIQRALGGI